MPNQMGTNHPESFLQSCSSWGKLEFKRHMVQWLMNHRQSYLAMMNVDIVEKSLLRVWRVCHAQVVQAIVSVTWIFWPMRIDPSPRRDRGDRVIIFRELSNYQSCPTCWGFSWLLGYWWYIFEVFVCYSIFSSYFSPHLTRLSISKSGCAFDSWSNFGSHLTTEWNIQTIFFVIGNSCYDFHPKCFHQDHWLSCCLNENSCLLYTGL